MSKYQGAGQYFERKSGGGNIPSGGGGIGTATLVVPGFYTDGPDSGQVEVVTNWPEFERKYGGLNSKSENGYAILGFFNNGGKKVIPLRITKNDAAVATIAKDALMVFSALFKGAKYNGLKAVVTVNADSTALFDISVKDASGYLLEKAFEGLTFSSSLSTSKNYYANAFNGVSKFMKLTGTGGTAADTYTLAGGSDGTVTGGTEIQAALIPGACRLDNQKDDCLLIITPDAMNVGTINQAIAYAESRIDCFVPYTPALVDDTPAKAIAFKKTITPSKVSACYWPHVKVTDLLQGTEKTMSAVGHVAGRYAATDAAKNVGKNPAGIVDGQLSGILGLSYIITDDENGTLYSQRVNPLYSDAAHGNCIWGCRTTSLDLEWIYINHERLFQFCEKKVDKASLWVNFENNDADTRLKLWGQLNAMFETMQDQKYFAGKNSKESFFVVCDDTNNTEATMGEGEMYIDYGIAPAKPGEFIIHRFRQKTLK